MFSVIHFECCIDPMGDLGHTVMKIVAHKKSAEKKKKGKREVCGQPQNCLVEQKLPSLFSPAIPAEVCADNFINCNVPPVASLTHEDIIAPAAGTQADSLSGDEDHTDEGLCARTPPVKLRQHSA